MTRGSRAVASASRRAISFSSSRSAPPGVPVSPSRSANDVTPGPQSRSVSTRRSTSSEAGRRRIDGAAPGRNRIPTTAVPGSTRATRALLCGPETSMRFEPQGVRDLHGSVGNGAVLVRAASGVHFQDPDACDLPGDLTHRRPLAIALGRMCSPSSDVAVRAPSLVRNVQSTRPCPG